MSTCAHCQSSLEVIDSDRKIYQSLSIPEPTLCPKCRNIRRMTWRNDRVFYHGKSALSGKPMISMYPPETPYKIYLQSEWYSDQWDPMDYGRDYDFNRPFFGQFYELQLAVPRMNLDIVNCENSDYCNYCGDDKNCYLDIAGEDNEDCYYNLFVKHSKDVADCTFIYNSRYCYECINCYNGYNLKYAQHCNNASDSLFVYDCIGIKNCLFSYNLRNKEYYIFNQPHSREEYEKKKSEILNGSYSTLQSAVEIWKKHLKDNAVFRDVYKVNCENVTGNDLNHCKNVQFGFNVTHAEDSKYLYDVLDAKDCLDLNYSLYKPELSVELISTLNMTHSAFSMASHFCHATFYSEQCNHSSHLFGCEGLMRKQYCILNKQYTKDEYEQLLPKIIEHMKSTGEWGEFFPTAMSPFAYNETVSQEYYPLPKEEALALGYRWSDDQEIKKYKGPIYLIPDNITEVDEELCKQVLVCETSGKPYKIIPQELKYYRTHHLPIPRKSPHQRHLDRMTIRSPRSLFDRTCGKCKKEIQSPFSPERPEKVYCEECYLKTVY